VPLDTEASRALLQRRIAFFALVSALLVGAFQLLGRIANLLADHAIDRALGERAISFHLVTLIFYVATWLCTRWGARSIRQLHLLDAFVTVVPPLNVSVAAAHIQPLMRPELILLLACGHELMLRGVVVPSSARRTFTLGVTLCIPIVVGTHAYYTLQADPRLPPPFVYTLGASAWASVFVSTVLSYTIFGLRQKVVEATQLGQYTLERKIGQGGMRVVYRARHAMLRRPTAIKLLAADRAGVREYARFEREVQLTSGLTHPNTIWIYDYGRTPEGVFYSAMEYLDGLDLQRLIETDGPQTPASVIRILEQVCSALAEAHAHGLIHRDIKPANVILCERGGHPGIAKVVDFGLVKRLDTATDSSTSTASVAIIGTPLYLSPEAILKPESVDARSDLYSLGAVGYFLLTGMPPFTGNTVVEVCGHHMHTPPIPPSRRVPQPIPAALDELIVRLLAKEPGARPSSAEALHEMLAEVGTPAMSRAELGEWWSRVLAQRNQPDRARVSGTPVGSSQTVAVDLLGRR
jgi:serine/threonine-protein kinase